MGMDTAIVNFLVGKSWIAVVTLIAGTLPGAALAYAVVSWAMRPRDGAKVPHLFASHAGGLITTVMVSAILRVIAITAFGRRSALEFADSGTAAFYILVIPAIVAATIVAWRKRGLATPAAPDAAIAPRNEAHASIESTAGPSNRVESSVTASADAVNEDYAEPLEEIEAGSMERGVGARSFAESRGDESKT
jgi:hypothetical protein